MEVVALLFGNMSCLDGEVLFWLIRSHSDGFAKTTWTMPTACITVKESLLAIHCSRSGFITQMWSHRARRSASERIVFAAGEHDPTPKCIHADFFPKKCFGTPRAALSMAQCPTLPPMMCGLTGTVVCSKLHFNCTRARPTFLT